MLLGLRFRWLLAAVLAAFVAVFVACSGSGSSTGIPPITGIVIRAETLTSGRGCGRGENQLFKYAAIVYGYKGSSDPNAFPADQPSSYDVPITAGIYDCFADGTFVELPAAPNGNTTFRLAVFAYSATAYEAARGTIETAGTSSDVFRTTNPTWSTECSATQLLDVQSLAVCKPLVSGLLPTSIILQTKTYDRTSGPPSVCARLLDAGTPTEDAGDAGDAGDASTDAADAGDADASADGGLSTNTTFLTVRATAHVVNGGEVVPQTDIACPNPLAIPNVVPGVSYEIGITLLDGVGATVGSTTCTAQPVAGTETAASCKPIQ